VVSGLRGEDYVITGRGKKLLKKLEELMEILE